MVGDLLGIFLFKICQFIPNVLKVVALTDVLQVIADIVAKNDGIERCLEDEFVCLVQKGEDDDYLKKVCCFHTIEIK